MKSLEFVKQRILDGDTWLDWTGEEIDAANIGSFSFFMNYKDMPFTFGGEKPPGFTFTGELTPQFPTVEVKYTPENDFDYFTSETFEFDGTYAFFLDALRAILQRIDTGISYNNEKADDDFINHPSLYHVRYEVGDVVIMQRFKQVTNRYGESFPGERVSICIPIKWDCEKKT